MPKDTEIKVCLEDMHAGRVPPEGKVCVLAHIIY